MKKRKINAGEAFVGMKRRGSQLRKKLVQRQNIQESLERYLRRQNMLGNVDIMRRGACDREREPPRPR